MDTPTSSPASSPSTALARVDVDGGHALYTTADGQLLTRDTDLSRWAGLAQARDLRRTIRAALRDGAIRSGGATLATGAGDLAVYEVEELAPRGDRGATQASLAYYLTEGAAILIATRLRTARAVALTQDIVRTYCSARTAAPVHPSPQPAAPPDRLDRLCGVVELLVGAVGQLLARDASRDALPPAPAAAAAPAGLPGQAPGTPAAAASAPVETVTTPVELPTTWISPSTMAARASAAMGQRVSANSVGRALAVLGYHDDGASHLRSGRVVQRPHGDGECTIWRYAPPVYADVLAYLRTARAPSPPSLADTARAAREAGDAIVSATTRPASRPMPRSTPASTPVHAPAR